jgi:hypothetical protein
VSTRAYLILCGLAAAAILVAFAAQVLIAR